MKISAGLLLYRQSEKGIEVLLVHPSGNYNRKAPWSLPKGLPNKGESLERAARRETLEETGVVAPRRLWSLGSARYRKSAKEVHAFAGKALVKSAPRCASWEVDQAEFVLLQNALKQIHCDQRVFLDRLLGLLASYFKYSKFPLR